MTESFLKKYGNPDSNKDGILDAQWFNENMKVFPLPFPMVLSWNTNTSILRFQAHRLAGDKIVRALLKMNRSYDLTYLRKNKLDRWGGCFNFRLIRGGSTLSAHSWGTAVDINPDIGRLGSKEDARDYPRFIVDAFESEGFIWGGKWERADSMHFQLED